MRTLLSASVLTVLCLVAAGSGFAQQAPEDSANSSSAANVANSPCRVNHDDVKVAHVKEGTAKGFLIHKVNPYYPPAARRARIEGTVLLCAAISKKGRIENLTAVSGPPELVASSLKAVKKWRYKPYMLNGEPVEVATEIRVIYALNY